MALQYVNRIGWQWAITPADITTSLLYYDEARTKKTERRLRKLVKSKKNMLPMFSD